MSVAQPLPIGFFVFYWKLPPLVLPRLLVVYSLQFSELRHLVA